MSNPRRMTREAIETEVRSRAARYLAKQQLVVDYYRIGRRLAFPLPLERITLPGLPVPGIEDYPWEIWLSWEMEERLNSLGWAAEWFKDGSAASAAGRELEALARWQEFTPNRRLDLCLGHTVRTLWQAYTQWTWLTPSVRQAIGKALDNSVVQAVPWVEKRYGGDLSVPEILAAAKPHSQVHNIPFIGLIGVALAANTRQSDFAADANQRVRTLLEVLMTLRQQDYSEGVAYDGYLLDFIACWIQSLPALAQQQILSQWDFSGFLDESLALAAPGEVVQLAEIGDVEPRHMPFHISAQARLQQFRPSPVRAWYLSQCRPEVLRADALAVIHGFPRDWAEQTTQPGIGLLDAHYARVLRSGWETEDLAVAVATSNSPAGHIHNDYGSITVGTAGRWVVADPGYQQYMPGEEREFTLGPLAHNAPLLNGRPQEVKAGKVVSQGEDTEGRLRLRLDLTACYPLEVGASKVQRTVWMYQNQLVVLADQIEGPRIETISYSWHGHPESAWRLENNWAMLHQEPASALWFTSPAFSISGANVNRLPGSRGQLTLTAKGKNTPVIWWIFSHGGSPPAFDRNVDGKAIQVMGQRFSVD